MSGRSRRDAARDVPRRVCEMVERLYAADSKQSRCDLATGHGLARSERSEAGPSGWIEPEPGVDVGRDHVDLAGGRSAPARTCRSGKSASSGLARGGVRISTPGRTLAWELCRVPHDQTRDSCAVTNRKRPTLDAQHPTLNAEMFCFAFGDIRLSFAR